MNKVELGVKLANMRNGQSIEGLTDYAVKSIEEARSSYPVANMLMYCNRLHIVVVLKDTATMECYPVENTSEVHDVLQMLMQRWQIDDTMMFRKTGIHYTAPKSKADAERGSLSIDTMLAMCKTLRCELNFVQN